MTQIELERAEKALRGEINDVDKKHTDNFSRMDKTISLLAESNKQLTKSIDSNTEEMKGMRKDNKENNDAMRESFGKLDKTVMEHDYQLSGYEGKFLSYDKAIDNKRTLNGKWIGIIGGAFTAFIGGMFGLAYIVAEHILPLILGR